MLPSAAEIQYFLEIANTKNISRAAERLGVTQPSLSLALKRLENHLGVQLLIRTKNGLHLTPSGRRFQNQARNLLNEWEILKSETLNESSELKGVYSIGCHPSVGLYTLHHFIPLLVSQFPHLELTLIHELSREITELVISFKVDIGLAINPPEHPDLVIHPICEDVVTLWQIDHPKAHDTLIFNPALSQSQWILRKLKKTKPRFKRYITSSHLEVITSLVDAGAGIGILPTRVAKNTYSKKLKPVQDAPKYKDKLCLVYRVENAKTKSMKDLIQFIKDNLADV